MISTPKNVAHCENEKSESLSIITEIWQLIMVKK